MTIRERIADWISGGLLTGARERAKFLSEQLGERNNDYHLAVTLSMSRESALRQIVAMETPVANATVLRMARVAREALEESGPVKLGP